MLCCTGTQELNNAATADPVVSYIPHTDFGRLSEQQICSLPAGHSIYDDGDESGLRLSADGEQFLFRKMNYLRWKADQMAGGGDCDYGPDSEFAGLIEDAEGLRNRIAESNVGLVRAVARRFSTSTEDFEELQSSGFEILLKAISLFDCSRGFRFSTYATHAVQRHYFRLTKRRSRQNVQESGLAPEQLQEFAAEESDEWIAEWICHEERMTELIGRMADYLDEREHAIVRGRFGLNTDRAVKSLRQLGEELGLSRERARQLQISALEKLRTLFDELEGRHSERMAV